MLSNSASPGLSALSCHLSKRLESHWSPFHYSSISSSWGLELPMVSSKLHLKAEATSTLEIPEDLPLCIHQVRSFKICPFRGRILIWHFSSYLTQSQSNGNKHLRSKGPTECQNVTDISTANLKYLLTGLLRTKTSSCQATETSFQNAENEGRELRQRSSRQNRQ